MPSSTSCCRAVTFADPHLVLLRMCKCLRSSDHLAIQLDIASKNQILCCTPGCNPCCRQHLQ